MKITLRSDCQTYGMMPMPESEIIQELSLHESGQVEFTSFMYMPEEDEPQECRTQRFKTQPALIREIYEMLMDQLEDFEKMDCGMDCGSFKLTIMDDDGNSIMKEGSLGGLINDEDLDLSVFIRDRIAIDWLWVFDSEIDEDEEDDPDEDEAKERQYDEIMQFIAQQNMIEGEYEYYD